MIFVVLLFASLAGCQNTDTGASSNTNDNLTEKADTQELPSEKDGVSFSSQKEEYTTSADTLTFIAENTSDTKVKSDYAVFIEKNIDGTWYKSPYTQASFPEPLRYLPSGESHTFEVQVAELENELTSGQYRAIHEGLAAPFEVIE